MSREINRNGGGRRYQAGTADQAAWGRARRPKTCKLVNNRALARIVAKKLKGADRKNKALREIMSKTKSAAGQRFLAHLERAGELRRQVITAEDVAQQQVVLSHWQSERLAATYADLSAQRRYRMAIKFFLSDLYGTKDFARRDADLVRIYPIMVRVLSENALESLATAVELHALTQELDGELLQALRKEDIDIVRNPDALNQELYARAYRSCDNYDQRVRQIGLIEETGRLLDEVVRHRIVFVSARLVRAPAHAAGLGELQGFIERGLHAFKRMRGATYFLQTIHRRESFILEQIFSGAALSDWSAHSFEVDQP